MKQILLFLSSVLMLFSGFNSRAQYLTKEEVHQYFQEAPLFSMYKDNYFITGVPLNTAITRKTADIKYQISIQQRVTRKPLLWDTQLILSYTQKSFWDIWDKSSPFKDINFNPAAGLYKAIYSKDEELKGLAILTFEHQSNGRDSIQSRSWNNVDFSYVTRLDENNLIRAELWVPFGYKEDNPDLLDYVGLFRVKFFHDFIPNKFSMEIKAQKGLKWNGNGILRTRFYYSPFSQSNNQYFMLEWYLGHAENLLNYHDFRNRIRIGYVIKTRELDFLRLKSKQR